MALNAKEKKFEGGNNNHVEQEPMEAGTYPARLVQVLDMGVQEQRDFQGQEKPPVQELMVTYEFADEFIKDEEGNDVEDKPRWLSETFPFHSLKSDLAKSTKRYYALDPNCEHEGDWMELIGAPVMVTVIANPGKGKNAGKVFNNIASTSAMREKDAKKLPDLKNPGKILDLDDADTADILLTLPEWIVTKVKNGLEWEGCAVQKALDNLGKKSKNEEPKKVVKNKKQEVQDEEPPFDADNNDDSDW